MKAKENFRIFDDSGTFFSSVDPGRSVFRGTTRPLFGSALFVLLLTLIPFIARAAGDLTAPGQMLISLENALNGQQIELSYLKTRVAELENLKKDVQNEIIAFGSKDKLDRNLLLVPKLERESLENAVMNNRLTSRKLTKRLKALQEHHNLSSNLFNQTEANIELVQKETADIRKVQLPEAQKQKLEATTQTLLQVLVEKKQLADRYMHLSEGLRNRLTEEVDKKKRLSEKLAARLETHKKTSLFSRTTSYQQFSGKALMEGWNYSISQLKLFTSRATWQTQWYLAKMGGFISWAVFLLLLVSILVLQDRFRKGLQRVENRWANFPDWYHSCLGLRLLRRSLPYIGMVLLFGIYSSTQLSLVDIGLGRVLFYTFLIILLTRWGLDSIEFGFQGPTTELRAYVNRHLKLFFQFFCVGWIVGMLVAWIAGRSNLLTWLISSIFSAVFLAWVAIFWHKMKVVVAQGVRIGSAAPNPRLIWLCKWWSYIVFGGALFFWLFGYRYLAAYWYIAWVVTIALLFWAELIRRVIQEWHRAHRAKVAAEDHEHHQSLSYELRWSLIQLARLIWLVGLAVGILLTWDSSGYLLMQLKQIVNAKVALGSLSMSLKGVLLATLILYLTRLVVNIGRALINDTILAKRTLEQGLILALGILGVNATSLAVVFGALSVGIGFGLQTIFNNFISGLILLFERPIQVGDTIEVNGFWSKVLKINVRATVVQTFDNASVIIPNSELISQRVTNWTFKDKRMRRSMEVGVAYGSDIDLVEKTLFDIVKIHKKILKLPKPQVLFIDHANSALVFRLRFWVHLNDYWSVPSEIRREIDRRFREQDIEIAFPQRDLHIRTLPQEKLSETETDVAEDSPNQNLK
jgi:small-conductance mechanosensitive channel